MKYRIIKNASWWTSMYTTDTPMFLYFDFDTEHFEIGGYNLARDHKFIFSEEEVKDISSNPGFNQEFLVERVKWADQERSITNE